MSKNIIFGLQGLIMTDQEKEFFLSNESKIHGFILFKRNIESKEQVHNLTRELKNLYPNDPPLIFVDQEGGRVARLKPPIIECLYPSAETFANVYNNKGKNEAIQEVQENYKNLAQDLKNLEIDSPCAPVLDLRYTYTDNVIGDRSFGNDVDKVEDLANAAIEGIKNHGCIPIIKHIPGHGRATTDSHEKLPVVDASLEDLNKTDFEIFRRLASRVEYAMSAHIIFKCLDENSPVTLSKNSINFIRNNIGFKGKLMTDALEMKALHQEININDNKVFSNNLAIVAAKALEAGCDIVLHCTGDLEQMQAIADYIN